MKRNEFAVKWEFTVSSNYLQDSRCTVAQINTEIVWKSDLEMLEEPLIESHIRLESTVKL